MAKQNQRTKTTSPSVAAEPAAAYGRSNTAMRKRASLSGKPLPMSRFRTVARGIALPMDHWSRVLHVPLTEWRQRSRGNGSLQPLETDRVLQVQEVYRRGEEVFGDREVFSRWMESKHLLLGKAPMDMLGSAEGINLVLDELIAIEHGLPA